MPIYQYECPSCSNCEEIVRSVKNYDTPTFCFCGARMKKKVSKISVAYVNKFSKVEESCRIRGERIVEPGIKKDVQRQREYREQQSRKRIRKVAEDTVREMDI
jgi:putative FmdB family regulatory protein